MRIISRPALKPFAQQYPAAQRPLEQWYVLAKGAQFYHFAEVKATFGSADQVGRFIVFNIGGNKFRLIVRVLYATPDASSIFWIDQVLTHRQYDDWRPT